MNRIRSLLRHYKNQILKVDSYTPIEKIKENQYILVSFPKSGRTWLQVMLREAGFIIPVTHDGSGHVMKVHYKKLIKKKHAYSNINVLFLIREPKDTAVSGYFHSTKRQCIYSGNIGSFVRNPRHGFEKIIYFHLIWLYSKHIPKSFLMIKYEDLLSNTFGKMKEILAFLKIKDVSDERLMEIINFAKFENMQTMEKNGYFKEIFGEGLTPKNILDFDSYKTRRGIAGGYKDYLIRSDIDYFNKIAEKHNYDYEIL
jgi:hypothetical protein